MKCPILLFLGLFAICYAVPAAVKRNISIGHDGTITINESNGKQIVISKNVDSYGVKHIEILVNGPFMPSKKIKILDEPNKDGVAVDEESREKRSSSKKNTQLELLLEIFQANAGVLDDKSYQKLLKKVEKAVESGDLSPEILGVLADEYVSGDVVVPQAGVNNVVVEKPLDYNLIEQRKVLGDILRSKLSEEIVPLDRYNALQSESGVLNRLPVNNNVYGANVPRSQLPLNELELLAVLNRLPVNNVYGNLKVVPQSQVYPVNWRQSSWPIVESVQPESKWFNRNIVQVPVPIPAWNELYLSGQNVPYYGYEGVQYRRVPQNIYYVQ